MHSLKKENFEPAIRVINRNDFLTDIDNRIVILQKPGKETYLFIKLTQPVFDRLREKGYIITRVLDGTLICSTSKEYRVIMYHGNNANF